MGIQKDEETVTEIDKDKVYQTAIDNMKSEIESLKLSHQNELTSIMVSFSEFGRFWEILRDFERFQKYFKKLKICKGIKTTDPARRYPTKRTQYNRPGRAWYVWIDHRWSVELIDDLFQCANSWLYCSTSKWNRTRSVFEVLSGEKSSTFLILRVRE